MNYSIELTRHESRTVEVFAENRDQALRLAEESNHGFQVDGVVELLEDGVTGAEHIPASRCEACRRVIWVGEKFVNAGEDADLCVACAESAPAA